ncbi:uncharacterized protein LOC143148601 [Ptiloglossa arizonensis]|uniref:uncharacterized protein LOC143148601 n=1 Tax=Ptiloglossa arizonensis TaxID=3350558 RepID=UPI003FA16292
MAVVTSSRRRDAKFYVELGIHEARYGTKRLPGLTLTQYSPSKSTEGKRVVRGTRTMLDKRIALSPREGFIAASTGTRFSSRLEGSTEARKCVSNVFLSCRRYF